MNVLLINASPKEKGGASRYFSNLLKFMLCRCNVTTVDVCKPSDYDRALAALYHIDALVISAPLYNDAIPAHFIPFLSKLEELCKEKRYNFKVYAISNGGFAEGIHNKIQLQMVEAFCIRSSLAYSGGIGVGGGVMLSVLSILLPVFIAMAALQVVITVAQAGSISL